MTVQKIEMLTVDLEAKPGALAKVYAAFHDAKVNVIASWGYQMGPGQAQAHFRVSDVAKAKEALAKLGKTPKVEHVVWAEGDDKLGAYHAILKKIADAGLNVEATTAFAIGGKFATVIFASDPKDLDPIFKAANG